MKLDDINIEAVAEVYLLANTPAYLYRQLQKHDAVHWLARNIGASELLKECRRIASMKERSLTDVAGAYAALVALLNKMPGPTDELLRTLGSLDLDWAPNIVAMFRAKPVSARRIEIDAPSARLGVTSPDAGASAARVTIQFAAAANKRGTSE